MTVRLRAHHLLCLLTYAGKGYSPAFIANYDVIAERLGRGEDILVVSGPDDICAPLLDEPQAHCRRESVVERDRLAAVALADRLARPVLPGERIQIGKVEAQRLRAEFSKGKIRAACEGCEWHDLCSGIAAARYRGVRFHGPAET